MENTPQGSVMDAVDDALDNEDTGLTPEIAEDELPEIPLEDDGEEGSDGEGTEDGEEGEAEGEEPGEVELDDKGKPVAKAPEKPAKKVPDPINDPIPQGLKKETSDRMRALIKTTRDLTAEKEAINTEFSTIINGIQSTGASPEQYGELLSWVSLFNSPNVESKKQAYQLVEDVANRMALQLGIERNVGDPYAKHPDIREALAKNQITPQYAKELVRTREQNAFRTQIDSQGQQQRQTQQQAEAELNQARASLNTIDAQLRQQDTLYDKKRAQLVPILKPIFKSLRPSQWPAAYQEAYRNVRLQRSNLNGRAAPKGQPMRAKSPAGSSAKQASSPLEAMNAALASMGK
jgi:hypothetical protein